VIHTILLAVTITLHVSACLDENGTNNSGFTKSYLDTVLSTKKFSLNVIVAIVMFIGSKVVLQMLPDTSEEAKKDKDPIMFMALWQTYI
jgi:hypothetical protein